MDMIDETVYTLSDGSVYVLLSSIVYNEIEYLLLSRDNDNEIFIAFDDNGSLKFIDSNDYLYKKLIPFLLKKIEGFMS